MNTSSSPHSSTPTARTRALVLGGGGSAGNAWLIGVIAGLADAGLDVTDADLIVGTSAGSTAAAQVTGESPVALLAAILESPGVGARGGGAASGGPAGGARGGPAGGASGGPAGGASAGGASAVRPSRPPLGRGHLEQLRAAIAASGSIAELRRTMGAVLEADTTMDSARWRDTVAARFRARSWPDRRTVVTAVDARTGEPVLFDRDSGVDLVDAVAASCAGGFAYAIGDRRFIDGGYRANADNADLAAGHERVLVLSPLGGRSFHPAEWGTHLSTQVDALREAGSRVVTVFPDDAAARAFGDNLMSPATRQPAARAGFDQGSRSAAELADFWG